MTTPETFIVTILARCSLMKLMCARHPDLFRAGAMPSAPSLTLDQWAARLPVAAELAKGVWMLIHIDPSRQQSQQILGGAHIVISVLADGSLQLQAFRQGRFGGIYASKQDAVLAKLPKLLAEFREALAADQTTQPSISDWQIVVIGAAQNPGHAGGLTAADCRHLAAAKFPESQVTSEFVLPSTGLEELSTRTFGPSELLKATASKSSESQAV